ncbi:unnamed protein product [Urochloa decumbens]|uniref:Uncharacterized protein n=1 Tax=Urochloa decumbens TaxID=240449 RepID=A0ABC9GCB2_9POAL
MGHATRPEELMNSLLKLRTATRNIANGLGVLALLWSTVVLLGGFVSVLRLKEFWVLTAMSILMASRMLDFIEEVFSEHMMCNNDNIFGQKLARWLTYVEEARIIGILGRLERIRGQTNFRFLQIIFIVMLVPKVILFLCPVLALQFVPFVSLGVSIWRLIRQDYGDADGNIANIAKLTAALDIFYALVLFLCLFVMYWMFLVVLSDESVYSVAALTNKQLGYEKWISKVVQMYYKETKRRYNKDGELPNKWNLIKYGAGLLQSASGDDDDHLWGARILDKLFDKDASVRQELLSSRSSIQNLIGMIGRRGTADNIENRERAARILAHLASDLHITHFPGTLQCICSLLESCNQFSEPQLTCPSSEKIPDEQSRSMETSDHQRDAQILVPIEEDQSGHEQEQADGSSSAGLAQRKRATFLQLLKESPEHLPLLKESREHRQQHDKDVNEWRRFTYRSKGAKELISQGLLILERLTQDEENCTKIRKHQRLLSKIISPLRSQGFPSNVRDKTMVEILRRSLKVVSRLLTTSPGQGSTTRIHQELASNTEAVSNLMGILETGSEVAQELHEQSLEILTELAFDDCFAKPGFGGSACPLNELFNNLLRILLEEDNHTVAAESDREKATRLRGKAGEALARLLPVRMASDANVPDILSRQEAIHLLTKVFNQILSCKMGTTADAVKRSIAEMENLVTEVFNKKMGKNERAKAISKTENLVTVEVISQILCSKMETTAGAAKRAFTRNENMPTEVLDELLSSKMETTVVDILRPLIQGIEKQSEERKFMAAMLSLAVVIYNENVISKEEFARAIPEDASLVKKLMEILKLNNQSMAECLRIVKLTCQVVIAMVQVKPSCIQHFNEHNFKEALTEALETMSDVNDCMLFAGNDRELIKPLTSSLASLVKEAQKLLNTA